jgi:hypothetical protein
LKLRSLFVLLLLFPGSAHALDKQGSAHGGNVEGDASGFSISGSAGLGAAIYNPSYAARPDNTGLALFRALAHFDIDLIGRRLSIPLDLNLFTDREAKPWPRIFTPSEVDIITGVTSTWRLGPGALEGGVRVERDQMADKGGYPHGNAVGSSQTYVDARARYLMEFGNLSGWATLGWFVINEAYFARPDNTGTALFRYALHGEYEFWNKQLAFGADTTFFTDRKASLVVQPSELDLTLSFAYRPEPFEFQIAYERDMPVDRGGLVQHFIYTVAQVSFDIVE